MGRQLASDGNSNDSCPAANTSQLFRSQIPLSQGVRGQLTVFGGEIRAGVIRLSRTGDCATTAVNSVPLSRWCAETKGFRFFVLIFSQMITCFIKDSGENFREHTGHKSRRIFGCGISMKISFSC
jgi:hypothetical protein